MSYAGISIRDVLDKINANNSGWYLPQVQRQYVWGARDESETYICLLLDSLLKGYPIGGIVLWETERAVPFRKFVEDYVPGQYAKQVGEGRWGEHKSLVYDGQQRLQTLYSVLRHSFNGRILHFDLLFDVHGKDEQGNEIEADDTGFLFRSKTDKPNPRYLDMTRLAGMRANEEKYIELEDEVLPSATSSKENLTLRKNLKSLWDVFVKTETKSIAFFSVKSDTTQEVNEVFRRLNTGGVALTQLELVLGKIKAVQSDYEERLWDVSKTISDKSGGIEFPSASILQFFHLLVKGTARIDEARIDKNDIVAFRKLIQDEEISPLVEFFSGYLSELLKINAAFIVPRWLAALPIMAYLSTLKNSGHEYRFVRFTDERTKAIHQYFLLSQFCDWNTQTMINAFAREAIAAARKGEAFPLDTIREIAIKNGRVGELHENRLKDQPWLACKVLMRERTYVIHERKPQIDHIFPLNLNGDDEDYRQAVDIIWNFQPLPAEVNRDKSDKHPKDYLSSNEGKKYQKSYDFIPSMDDDLWSNPLAFIEWRKKKMLDAIASNYGLIVHASPVENAT